MKNLTIKPVAGGEIQFGKFPLFSRNIGKVLGLSDVEECPIAQFKVEGRYFAIELKPNAITLSNDFDAHLKTVAEAVTTTATATGNADAEIPPEAFGVQCNSPRLAQMDYEEYAKEEKKVSSTDLSDLGFTNLPGSSASKPKSRSRSEKTEDRAGLDVWGKPIARGDLELKDWLKSQDYLVYKAFVFANGRAAMDVHLTHDDVTKIFIEAGFPNKKMRPNQHGANASRMASVAISQLLRGKVIQKSVINGIPEYSLTITRGGQYARRVYRVINAGTYGVDKKNCRVLYGE